MTSVRSGFGACAPEASEGGAAARLEHGEGFPRHVAANRVEYGVAAFHHAGEILGVVVDDLIGAETTHVSDVRRTRRRDHAGAENFGELDGEAGDAACPTPG